MLKPSKTAKRRSGIASVIWLCNCNRLFGSQWKELILLSAKRALEAGQEPLKNQFRESEKLLKERIYNLPFNTQAYVQAQPAPHLSKL
jgi:hypothetical protein